MSNRLNFPIWADCDTDSTGFTLQHLVNGSWVNTDMRTCALPAGYTNEVCLSRYIEKDIKSTAPNLNVATGITPQPDAYQVYRMVLDGVETREMGFFNDWSYEMYTGSTRCISAPINRHADARQHLLYGNFAETGNSIIVKEMVQPFIKMQPNSIAIGAEQYQTVTIVVTSNTYFELILPEWLSASQTAFTSGTTVAYLYPQTNTSFDSRQFTIQAKHEGYWDPDYEYTNLAHVVQSGKVAYLTIYPDPLGVAWDTTGLTSVTVYTNTDFTATTNSSDTWLTYSGKTEVGTNYYNVYFNVSANTGDNRQTHAYFEYVVNSSGGTYTRALRVVQAKAPDITIEPQLREIDYTAQGIRIRVESEANWTASSSESWISVPESGISGVSLIFVDVSVNAETIMRSGSVTFNNGVKSVTFNVIQNAINLDNNYFVYKSTDHNVVTPSQTGSTFFGANMLSNTYYAEGDYGIIVFDDEIKTLGDINRTHYIYGVFNNCNKLLEIIIPDSVTSITSCAFYKCSSLSSITIPDSVTTIGGSVFSECTALSSITIGSGITHIGRLAFEFCTALSSITVDSRNVTYNDGGGSNCIIETSTNKLIVGCYTTVIPNTVTEIGSFAYWGCERLSSITIPNSVTIIDSQVFYRCRPLESVIIPDSVTTIGGSVFGECAALLSITIGSGVTTIINNPINLCPAISSITVDSRNTSYNDGNGSNCIIETATNKLIVGCNTTVIPNGVVEIGYKAFYGYNVFTSITIPDSVTIIGNMAFGECRAMENFTIPENVTTIGDDAFTNSLALSVINYNGTIAQWNSITKGSGWRYGVPATVVHCTDGDVPI